MALRVFVPVLATHLCGSVVLLFSPGGHADRWGPALRPHPDRARSGPARTAAPGCLPPRDARRAAEKPGPAYPGEVQWRHDLRTVP